MYFSDEIIDIRSSVKEQVKSTLLGDFLGTSLVRDEPLIIWRGLGPKREKKTQLLLAWDKKTQLNNLEEKDNSSAGWPGKKNSTRILCSRPPQIINGPSLM